MTPHRGLDRSVWLDTSSIEVVRVLLKHLRPGQPSTEGKTPVSAEGEGFEPPVTLTCHAGFQDVFGRFQAPPRGIR